MVVSILASILLSQTTLGKSDADVLKMGRAAWYDHYTQSQGTSTADMCDAERSFGLVLLRRNERAISTAKTNLAKEIASVRRLLESYMAGVYDVGTALTGGGTMWNVVYAGIRPDVEEVVGHLLGFASSKAKPQVASKVDGAFESLREWVKRERKSIEEMPSGGGMASAIAGLGKAKSAWRDLKKISATMPKGHADAMLSACVAACEEVKAMAGDGS